MSIDPAVTRASDRFENLFAEWLRARAGQISEPDDDVATELCARESQLAREITATPAVFTWQVGRKLEILEHYLGDIEEGCNWTDNRQLVILASIKADIMRFGLKSPY